MTNKESEKFPRQGAYNQALSTYQKAVAIEPNPLIQASLAVCYFKLGDEEEYLKQIEIAREFSLQNTLDEYNQACH